MPFTLSVMYEDEAMADPHPKVLNLTSEMTPGEKTVRIVSLRVELEREKERLTAIIDSDLKLHHTKSRDQFPAHAPD